jgi:ABC-type transport system involved in multi-copper enzyme maturation permease subunit
VTALAARMGSLGLGPRLRDLAKRLRWIGTGIAAIGIKELRGRMRGRRAFAIITIHLLLLAGFALLVQEVQVRSMMNGFSGSSTADIGRGLFVGLLILLTIIVMILAPGSTAAAISLEREKQTLDMLVTTPVSSIALVLGKLLASVGWIVLLLLASLPVMALVFTFGGVAPEDIVRGYIVLAAAAFAYGAMGLFISALIKRTQASTIINLVLALGIAGGSVGLYGVGVSITLSDAQSKASESNTPINWADVHLPPSAMLWINPFASQVDVACGTDTTFSAPCYAVVFMTDRLDIVASMTTGVSNGDAFGIPRDSYWPRGVASMLVMGIVLVLLSSQLLSPTRRWHFPRIAFALQGRRRAAAQAPAQTAPETEVAPVASLAPDEPNISAADAGDNSA